MRARIIDLDPARPVDLVALAGDADDGRVWLQGDGGLAAIGVARRIELPDGLAPDDACARVRAVLEGIDTDDEVLRPATGPIALGALPFDRDAPASFVVPRVVVGRGRDGRQWLTSIDGATVDLDRGFDMRPATPTLPDGFTLTSPRSHDEFKDLVRDAVKAIDAGDLEKVVVAREVVVETNRPIVVSAVVERLHALYPSCTVFSMDGFVGASPELLVERRADRVRCHPLAGTFPRSGDPEADEVLAARLQASVKDRSEHRFVIDEIETLLRPMCDELDVAPVPSILPLRNVLHLGTEVAGRLKSPAADAIDLVRTLHPTPAVAGTPTAAALRWLAEHEPLARSRYAGPVGWMDRNGDGSFVVGIRSAELAADRRRARLFTGVGLVAGSEPESELVETQLKLQALLAALVRP